MVILLVFLLLCGDISSNPGPWHMDRLYLYKKLTIHTSNSKKRDLNMPSKRALSSRPPDEVKMLTLINNFHLFAMSETWLNSTWSDPELVIDGNTIYRCDRKDATGGETAILCKGLTYL